jgi:tetratricopeptide (TPR) repeat protein
MSSNEEGIRTRRDLMAGDDSEKAAAAAYELGVYYMNSPEQHREAESCFRHAIGLKHPAVTPAALLRLAGLLRISGRVDESVNAYRELIALKDSPTRVLAIYGLSAVLVRRPEHASEAEALLREAADSGDPEYGPLAAYDLGALLTNQPGRLQASLEAFRRAAESKHPESAPRAWFNIGVLLAAQGSASEAEAAYRSAVASNDPDIRPMALVNLGALLAESPARGAEAEAAYQLAIDSHHPDQQSLACLGLANLLAGTPGRRADSENAYRRAMVSTSPRVAASAAYNCGVHLLEDPSRRGDAEAAFREAVASGDSEHAPLALFNLAKLLAENVNRWSEARQLLETAVNTRDQRVVGPASRLLVQLNVSELPERLIPRLNVPWRCMRATSAGAYYLEEYLKPPETCDNWSAIVTAQQVALAGISPLKYMEVIRASCERRVINGRLTWTILEQTEDELIYESEMAGDIANIDQNELTRIVRRNDRLFTIQHAVRGDLAGAHGEKRQRLEMLHSARFERAPAPSCEKPTSSQNIAAKDVLAQISRFPELTEDERLLFCRSHANTVSKLHFPQEWALFHFQLALAPIDLSLPAVALEEHFSEAEASMRRALEVLTVETAPDLWGRGIAWLGRLAFQRAYHHRKTQLGQEYVQIHLSNARAALEKARTLFRPGSFEWCEIMVDLGDVQLSLDLDAAAATYNEMLGTMSNAPPLAGKDNTDCNREALASLAVRAIAGVQSIDRSKHGEPVVPPERPGANTSRKALYLRPLLSAGHLTLQNRCVVGAFDAGFRTEPDTMTLESLVYRVLGRNLTVASVGGRPEGYGAARWTLVTGGDDWRGFLEWLEPQSDLIVLVPHSSDGVRWELDLLLKRGALRKTLFIMPPCSADTDVAAMWAEAEAMMRERGLQVIPYQNEGGVYRLEPDGTVAERWPFDLLWNNTFLSKISHLLPAAKDE